MKARSTLERRTRIAITVALALVAAGPAVALRNCVLSIGASEPIADPHATDGLLKLKSGATIFLPQEGLSARIEQWLNFDSNGQSELRILDTSFVRRSTDVSAEGRRRIEQLAQVLNADPQLRAKILVLNKVAGSDLAQLGLSRATRIRSELLANGVRHLNVAIEFGAPPRGAGAISKQQGVPAVAIQLSR